MLYDHLSTGKYDSGNVSSELLRETASVSKTNTCAERDFGMLDRLIREKPNANLITLEAVIMSRTNKMSEWRNKLSEEKKRKLMEFARVSKKEQYSRKEGLNSVNV